MMAAAMHSGLELTKVDEGCWRVCDGALDEHDPRRVIAFVECRGERAAVLWLRSRAAESIHRSFDEAMAAIERSVSAEGGADRSNRPVPIRHFPPPRRRDAPA